MSDCSTDEFVVVNPIQDVETVLMKDSENDALPSTASEGVKVVEAFVEEPEERLLETVDEKPAAPAVVEEDNDVGLQSVMPSTMARAQQIIDTSRPIIQDVAECGTSVAVAAAATKALNKPTDSDVTKAAVLGGYTGKVVGQSIGDGMQWLFPLIARYCGAHQCDHCGEADLYNYYKQKDGVDKDLCHGCYGKLGTGADVQLDQTFKKEQLVEHDNTLFTLRIFLTGLAAAIILKQLWLLIFGK